jgi:hypothetical protein
MSVRKGFAAVLVALGLVLGAATPARAVEEGWSCSFPPAGWTFVAIQQRAGYCGSPYPTIRYNLALPKDGLVACGGLRDWAVSGSWSSYNSCGINSIATQVRLAKPAEGLWSCSIPTGWTYTRSRLTTNVCGTGQFNQFQLTKI